MRKAVIVIALAFEVALITCSTLGAATVTGHVVVTRMLTPQRVILPLYAFRGVSVGTPQRQDSKPFSTADELSRVVVYLEGPGLAAGAPVAATLSQKNMRFDPEIVAVPVGSTVSFPNEDPIFHNVFSLSKAKTFDLGYYPKGSTRLVKFPRPGVVQVYCHIHADMAAAILVIPSAWWTRPDRQGDFTLQNVPPGKYELFAWHRSAGFFRRRITVSAGETLKISLTIPVDAPAGGESLIAGRAR